MIVNPDMEYVYTSLKPKISGNAPKNFQKTKKYNNLQKTKRTLNTEI